MNMANLLDMPCEIRNMLYKEVLGTGRNIDFRNQNELATLAVSKQLRDESSSYFYQHNAVTIYVPASATTTATILPPIADRYLRFLRRLTIRATVGHSISLETRKIATAIAALAGIGAKFTELNIYIESSLSRILNCRVDDSIMGSNHAITSAIRTVLRSDVAKKCRIHLEGAWFAPGVAKTLKANFSSQLEFIADQNTLVMDASTLERELAGQHASTHLTGLNLSNQDITDITSSHDHSSSSALTPSPLPFSRCSPFSDLDAFDAQSFGMGSEDNEDKKRTDSVMGDDDASEPFFSEDDIEGWSGVEEQGTGDEDNMDDLDDLDVDEEMEDVDQDDLQALVHNQQEIAHRMANESDIIYGINFAPDWLLYRHNMGHLV
jgi:hypothetical protein